VYNSDRFKKGGADR